MDYQKIIKKIRPSESEEKEIQSLSTHLIKIINENAHENCINAQAVLVGSVGKGTWISGKADIDIFIKFTTDTSADDLKEKGLYLGKKCIEMVDGEYELRYASHPYITGLIENYTVDFVPCYDIQNIKEMKSAVDRTIAHTEYVIKTLKTEQKDEVLLLKSFMKSIDTYGSEFKVGGFAGYLCELLIINYGSFLEVLKSSSVEWKPGYQIDLAKHGTASHYSEPLVVVDPVDKNRNVAAALTLQKMSEFVNASRNFLNKPSPSYFIQKEPNVDLKDIKEEFIKRSTKCILLAFKAPNIPADALYPQIKKTEKSIVQLVERNGFKTFGSDSWTDEKNKILILLEFDTWKLPQIKKHYGPPVWSRNHENKFLKKYTKKAWLEEDRWVALVKREHTNVENLLEIVLSQDKTGFIKFGKHIKSNLLDEYELYDLIKFLDSQKIDNNLLKFLFLYLHKNWKLWR
ncbi:MAG: CCA tRNA nucleotidyltransferase [Methanobacterium sp.]|nr:CCA tRNA nucleotidyltransferase [Methanobacterium sp.]